ncbi:11126_t:CDS:2 [Funneliformis geosporum]|uniref:11126_t:CDS:1 n=1 Tax=Funneliformis geosporum TaxID=1117311 RepID=A0A9W4SM27_9GLOM|nr:11126_t:CDS:2 [Funneliformis geosporum]
MAEMSRENDKIITYLLLATGEKRTIRLTSGETDPDQGKISRNSPVGMALSEKRVGEITEVKTSQGEYQEQQVGRNYLKENKTKVRAIIVVNTNWQNVGLLADISQEIVKSPLRAVIETEKDLSENFTSSLKKKENEDLYLLVDNPERIEQAIKHCLNNFSPQQKAPFQFIVGIPPVIGGEMRLARIIDYLYTQSEEIINLSKKEYLSLGVSFYDLKLLLQLLQPLRIITLQNSYKNKNFFTHLPGKFLTLDDGYAFSFPDQKLLALKVKETLIKDKLQLKEVKIEPIAISSALNIPKLTTKIKNWSSSTYRRVYQGLDNVREGRARRFVCGSGRNISGEAVHETLIYDGGGIYTRIIERNGRQTTETKELQTFMEVFFLEFIEAAIEELMCFCI